jgi:transcriptional regulator with XRE-family HTH domain
MFDLVGLGNRISAARKDKGFTQSYVSKLLHIQQSVYSNIENGKYNISVSMLYEISSILDVSIIWLIGENSIIDDYTDSERLEIEKFKKYIKSIRK